ncbi:hypothetical protein AB0J86_11020 [Micromonospora sp. NPDC049559]|uniref:hypothetical protein n=1 Tax=Micromonospora sp. NPDC049559 TaxID=3155923 RepID=UPI003417D366
MTIPAQRARRWPDTLGLALPLLLAVALLVPVAVLFLQARQTTDADRAFAQRERHGVEYLRALGPVTVALVDAESATVAGRTVPGEELSRAVAEMTTVDTRLGGELRARDRWAGLRAKIEALPQRGPGTPDAALTAYSEVTDLLLELYGKVREFSGLARDPVADSYYLQDSAGEELPESLVAIGRLADLAVLASHRRDAERDRTIADLGAARSAALSPADDLVDDLLAAVEQTEAGNLGSNLLSQVDAFQRAMETLGAATVVTAPAGGGPTGGGSGKPAGSDDDPAGSGNGTDDAGPVVDVAKIGEARTSAQTAAVALSSLVFAELDVRLTARVADLDGKQRLALGITALAVLLALAAVSVALLGTRRRAPRAGHGGTGPGTGITGLSDGGVGPAGGGTATVAEDPVGGANRPFVEPAGRGSRPEPSTAGAGTPGGSGHWGRSDAAR